MGTLAAPRAATSSEPGRCQTTGWCRRSTLPPRLEYFGSSEARGQAAGSSPTHHTTRGAAGKTRSYAVLPSCCREEPPRQSHICRRPLRAARTPTRRDEIPPLRRTPRGHDVSGRVAPWALWEGRVPLRGRDARRSPWTGLGRYCTQGRGRSRERRSRG